MTSNSFQEFQQFRQFQLFLASNANNSAPQPSTPTPANRVVPDAGQDSSQAAPVTQAYTSTRTMQPPPLVVPPSYQPFLGLQTLAPLASTLNAGHTNQQRLTTSNVNRDRLAHANAVLPRSATAGLVARRPRGPARPSPVLPNRREPRVPGIARCLVVGADVPTANILVLVYPPLDPTQEYLVYRMLHGDFVESLEHQHLVYRYALTIDTLVNDLLTRVVTDMVASPAAFIFAHARRASTSASAAITTLQPLGLRDRGRVSAIGVRLQVEPQDLDTTIHDLSLDTARFGGRMCFKDGAFIIRLAVMGPTLTGVRDGRCHGCIGTHLYALFPRDTSTMAEDEEETSGGESESEDDTGEAEVARLLWPILTPSDSRPRPNARRARPTSTAEVAVLRDIPLARRAAPAPLARRSRTRSLSPEISFSLPPRIWSNDENSTYHPHPSGDFGPHRFFDSVCRAAARGRAPVPPVVIRGPDVDALVDSFNDALDAAGRRNDYSEILTVVYALTTGRAVGDGVRREVITAALQRYLTEETSWFQRGEEEVLTLRTLFPVTSSSLLVPASRLLGFKRLGAICALHHIFGQSPDSISPAIFQYIIHRCNLDAITPAFTSEWFPELSHLLRTFLETSETGDLRPFQTHFVSFHGVEVSAFRTRDLATHQGLAVNMLFKPTIANNTFEHPELQSFRLGYLFRCGANDAFDLPYAIRNFEGGSEPFLSLVATSSISSADSVLGLLDVANPPNLVVHITALRDITGDMTLTFDMVFERFLRTVGLPCPQMFEARRGAFHRMIDLSEESINKPAFRPRIVVWALTGSPSIDSTAGHRISLGPINTHGEGYGGPDLAADERDLLASVGTFHLATCHRTVRYPVEHVLRLAQAQYVPEGEPGDFQEAFDFWFLYQCLIAIGRYNIV